VNSPDATTIQGGRIVVEFVDESGNVVASQSITKDFLQGPTVVPITFNVSSFSPAYQAGHDYTMLAYLLDSQGDIIDAHGRVFSTFGADPQPLVNAAPSSWNFGTVTQGAQPQQVLSIVNTGLAPLSVMLASS